MVEVDDRSRHEAANRKDQLGGEGSEQEEALYQRIDAVSYTHLTLPTILAVYCSAVLTTLTKYVQTTLLL